MTFTNQSGGSAPRKVKGYAKAGCEDPAAAAHVELGYSHKHTMPVAAMAGSLTRKIPGQLKAGQDVAGKSNQLAAVKAHSYSKLKKSKGGKAAL